MWYSFYLIFFFRCKNRCNMFSIKGIFIIATCFFVWFNFLTISYSLIHTLLTVHFFFFTDNFIIPVLIFHYLKIWNIYKFEFKNRFILFYINKRIKFWWLIKIFFFHNFGNIGFCLDKVAPIASVMSLVCVRAEFRAPT